LVSSNFLEKRLNYEKLMDAGEDYYKVMTKGHVIKWTSSLTPFSFLK
jgi:hypothetical protein